MISLGGQAPHVLRAHVWALNTCGEPNEIELAIRVLTSYFICITAPFAGPAGPPRAQAPAGGPSTAPSTRPKPRQKPRQKPRRRGHGHGHGHGHGAAGGAAGGGQNKDGDIFRVGVLLDFVRRSGTTRAEGPHGGASYVRGAERNRVDCRPRIIVPFFFRRAPTLAARTRTRLAAQTRRGRGRGRSETHGTSAVGSYSRQHTVTRVAGNPTSRSTLVESRSTLDHGSARFAAHAQVRPG